MLGGPVQAIALQADGKFVVAGGITRFAGSVGAVAVARFNPDGTMDSSFTPPSLPALSQSASLVAVQNDGSLVVAGAFSSLSGAARSGIARLAANGTVDTSWGGAGVQGNSLTDKINSLIPQPDGKILLGGTFVKFSDTNKKGFVRLNADGSIDPSLNYTDGSTGWAAALALQPDGKIVAGGTFTLGSQTYTLLRLQGAGAAPTAPVISAQPQGQTVTAGAVVNLSVTATGGAGLSYQWFKDGVPLNGETHATLSIFNIRPEQAGSYHVVVSNATGPTRSDLAAVVVNSPPVIATPPLSQTVSAGATVTFTVAATGTAPLTFQWQFNDADLPNETAGTLTVPNAQPGQAGKYRVVVRNSIGNATSTEAVLTVNVAPPAITRQPQSQTVTATENTALPSCSNLTAGNIPGAVFAMTVLDGAAPFASTGAYKITLESGAYHLSANGINPARDGTWTFAPDLGIATVLTVNNYFGDARITHWALLSNCEYELYADNLVSSQHGTYTVSGGSTNPVAMVTLTVEASGVGLFKYQWRFNGSPIPGAESPVYTVAATSAAAGVYTVLISNAGGSTLSDPATLTVDGSAAQGKLQAAVTAQGLQLSWPAGYVLESSAALGTSWATAATTSPQTFGFAGRQR